MSTRPSHEEVLRTLREFFGISTFRGQQQAVVEALLDAHSALAVFPTGAGKSLCYQLPALLFPGLTIVVSPLIALMKDQVEKLRSLRIDAARIDSTLSEEDVEAVFAQIRNGDLSLLYVSPERLAASSFRKQLKGITISLLAIDEAHCISEWGHNFRPDYLKISRLTRKLKIPRILALTATATRKVAGEIRKGFRIRQDHQFHSGTHRPNLHITVTSCSSREKDDLLLEKLRSRATPAIVYAATRNDTERIATMLHKQGFAARAYHAGLTAEMRSLTQESFMRGTTSIVVATIAFGMGIDKADIRTIIHYHLPKCIEGYSQEIGRAGRDGSTSHCELFACGSDTKLLENHIHGATPSPQSMKNLLDRILRLARPGKAFAISPYELSTSNDMREESLRTILAYLELDDIIQRAGSYHCYFRVKPLRPLDRIVAGYAAKEKNRIRALFAAAESAYGSLHFKLYEIAESTGIEREVSAEIIRALADAGDIRLEQRGLREVYFLQKSWDGNIPPVIDSITQRFESRACFEFERIRAVTQYVESRTCRAQVLGRYFGTKLAEPCGTCDLCLGAKPIKLRSEAIPPIPDYEWQLMRALRNENHACLATPRQLARYLCGISSPAAYQARLQQREEFGIWQQQPFTEVLAMLLA